MSEKWQVPVYLIHKNNKTTKEVYKILENTSKNYIQKRNMLKSKFLGVEDSQYKYGHQKLINNQVNRFELFLFYRKHRKSIPEWKPFFDSEVEDGEEIKVHPTNMNESFVFFLYHENSKKLYAISGGYGAFTIQKYIDDDFGINILVRIVSGKGEKVLKHAREYGVTGGLIGVSKYFRQNHNFYENKNFGNIYREISASIDTQTARELGISTDETKQCIAKNSFKINYSITFSDMINIVEKLNLIISRDANFDVNSIKKIDVSKNEILVKELEKKIINDIWEKKTRLSDLDENLDFLHKDFEKFLKAEKYIFDRQTYDNYNSLMNDVIARLVISTKTDFKKNIKIKGITSLDEDNNELTNGKVYNHLVCEVSFQDESYFLINGDYYQITSDFKNNLNESCKLFINDNYDVGLTKPWNSGRESDYNLLYKGDPNTVVLDTITPENIEPCDILKYDTTTTYLYHVKKGFNGSMRDLTNQVYISANRILEDKITTKEYIKSIFTKMEASNTYKSQITSENEFLSLFDKKLCFVIAIKDTATTSRQIRNIERFNSNIAKFALNELINNMKNLGVELKITQIS